MISKIEQIGKEVSLDASEVIAIEYGNDQAGDLPIDTTSKVFRYKDLDSNAYTATNIICAVRSSDDVVIQAHIKSKGKQTRKNHVRVRLQGFDIDEILVIDWTTGNMGVACGQNEVLQYKTNQDGIYNDLVRPLLSFSNYTYADC